VCTARSVAAREQPGGGPRTQTAGSMQGCRDGCSAACKLHHQWNMRVLGVLLTRMALLMNLACMHTAQRLKESSLLLGGPPRSNLCIHHRSAHRHVTRDRSRSQLTRSTGPLRGRQEENSASLAVEVCWNLAGRGHVAGQAVAGHGQYISVLRRSSGASGRGR
jgi:hypothetical protein